MQNQWGSLLEMKKVKHTNPSPKRRMDIKF